MTQLEQFAVEMEKLLALQNIDVDAPMAQLGVDSMNIVEMVIICQQIYTQVANYEDINIDENTTIRELDEQMQALSLT